MPNYSPGQFPFSAQVSDLAPLFGDLSQSEKSFFLQSMFVIEVLSGQKIKLIHAVFNPEFHVN